jgi:hypothetical protein
MSNFLNLIAHEQFVKDMEDEVTKAKNRFKETDKVHIISKDWEGEVVGFNRKTNGPSPGDRFPITVKVFAEYFKDKRAHIFDFHYDDLEKI